MNYKIFNNLLKILILKMQNKLINKITIEFLNVKIMKIKNDIKLNIFIMI